MYGLPSARPEAEPDWLDYDIKGRTYFERLFGNIGHSFVAGTISGGLYGGYTAYRNAPSTVSRVKLTSFVNGAGRTGSKWGNALGVLSTFYTTVGRDSHL